MNVTAEVDPAVTSNHTFRHKGGEVKYGISYASDKEFEQNKANQSLMPWHDLENKDISHELKIAEI